MYLLHNVTSYVARSSQTKEMTVLVTNRYKQMPRVNNSTPDAEHMQTCADSVVSASQAFGKQCYLMKANTSPQQHLDCGLPDIALLV